MATISPFTPLRYNPEVVPDPGAVIAPPYDVISEEKRQALIDRDEHNVIRLILPEGTAETKYDHAGELFHAWIDDGTLVPESGAAIFPYSQTFTHPLSGSRIERLGFLAVVKLAPFSEGIILPHERTLSGPKADRLALMRATDANLEPIFGVYRDADGVSSSRLHSFVAGTPPAIEAVDSDGAAHRVWRATDEATIAGFRSDLERSRVFIVDGHHRYETALNYRTERRAAEPDLPADAPIDYIMIFLTPTSDPGLVILPTHRVVHSLPDFDFAKLIEQLAPYFEIREVATSDEGLALLDMHTERPAYLLAVGSRLVLALLRSDAPAGALMDAALPAELRELDVTVLHEFILERLLGITKEAQLAQQNLRYVKSSDDAFAEATREDVQVVVLMNPTRLEQVEQVAESGEVMPQKSTYFYPKLASGLLFNKLGS